MNFPVMIRDYLFGFKGRIARELMWVYLLIAFAVSVVLSLAMALLGPGALFTILAVPVAGLLLWSTLAVGAKRRHDRNQSGGIALIVFVVLLSTYVPSAFVPKNPAGQMIMLAVLAARLATVLYFFVVLFCLKGTTGENDYGPDPVVPELNPNNPNYVPAGYSVKIDGAHQEFYYVAESNRERARAIVRDGRGAPDSAVTIIGTILHQTVAKLGLKHGEFVAAPRLSS